MGLTESWHSICNASSTTSCEPPQRGAGWEFQVMRLAANIDFVGLSIFVLKLQWLCLQPTQDKAGAFLRFPGLEHDWSIAKINALPIGSVAPLTPSRTLSRPPLFHWIWALTAYPSKAISRAPLASHWCPYWKLLKIETRHYLIFWAWGYLKIASFRNSTRYCFELWGGLA